MNRYFFLLILTLFLPYSSVKAQESHIFETTKALDVFNALYRDLDLYYVDTLNAENTINDAIVYMLGQLDPYTEFYKENRTDELKTLTTGKYAGIGSPIRLHGEYNRCVFDNPYMGMPAWKAGVRTGDIILKIDDKDVGTCERRDKSTYSRAVSQLLRGEPGTSLSLTVKRPSSGKVIRFKMIRQTIKQPTVIYYAVLPGGVGYLMLSGFTEDTAKDMLAALENLKLHGTKSLVLDLRANGGGLMSEAVKVVNFFIPQGRKILETKGKDPATNEVYRAMSTPWNAEIPLAILVDYGTASAAEITSGSLQDYDRAVIVGRRTYGKGLVQSPRQLPYNTMMKLTTSKYYIPSGRCIQAYDFKHRGADGQPRHLPDSLCKTFYTAAGRPVKDGGGVMPDIEVQLDSLPDLLSYLQMSDALFDYCVRYRSEHKEIAPPVNFKLTDEEFEQFKDFMSRSKFSYKSRTLQVVERVRQLAAFEGYENRIKAELEALEKKLSPNLSADIEHWKKSVRQLVEVNIIAGVYGQSGVVAYRLREDKDLEAALSILADKARYHRLLKR